MYPTPQMIQKSKVLLTVRLQLVLTMVWGVVRVLEFVGKTVDFLVLGLGRKKMFPVQLVRARLGESCPPIN